MSNNIYDILNKINKLEGKVQTLKESKSMDKKKEDKKDESKKKDKVKEGAIAEAVARVEKQLSEKYHGFKKMQESEVEESGLQAYLGKKKYGETGMRALQKAGREGASKEKMAKIRAQHDKMDEGSKDIYNKGIPDQGIVGSGKPDPKELGRYLDHPSYRDDQGTFYDQLGNPRSNPDLKNQMNKDRTYPVYEPGLPPDRPVPGKMKEDAYNEDMLSPKQQKIARMAGDPKKIDANDLKALRAGKNKKAEGNEFSGELVKARAQGKDSFEVDGKTYQVKEGFPSKEDAEKRMKEREGKTAHGKKTATKTGVKHERDYDKHDSEKDTGDEKKGRGRPKKDKFAK